MLALCIQGYHIVLIRRLTGVSVRLNLHAHFNATPSTSYSAAAITTRDEFTSLVSGKTYGLLTEEEDARLMPLTTTALDRLRA